MRGPVWEERPRESARDILAEERVRPRRLWWPGKLVRWPRRRGLSECFRGCGTGLDGLFGDGAGRCAARRPWKRPSR